MTQNEAAGASTLRVLIVDDDRAIQELYRTFLSRHGCSCDIAASGRDALLVLMKQNFDVLVVDLRMENMDGLVFLQEALKIWPWLAVVISSGYVTPDIVKQARGLGITRVLKKSEKMEMLVENVLAAATERRDAVGVAVEDNALRLMRAHMRMMTRLTRSHAETDLLVGELSQFGDMLSEMLSAELSGIMIYRDDEHDLILTTRSAVRTSYTDQVADEMMTRFNILAGRELTLGDVTVRHEGVSTHEEGLPSAGKIVSVPIIMGDDISGLLTLASADPAPYSSHDISLLYHAANHVSTLFITLQEIHALAAHDALTGVYNRLRLDEELARAWDICRRYSGHVGVIILDLDHIKGVNDTYGHAVGDAVLKEFADIISVAARSSDIVARYGGDEFVIILPRVKDHSANVLAKRILERTREHTFCDDSLKLTLSTSIGVASSSTEPLAESAEELLRRADEALYDSKRGGRNQMHFWGD
jgi:diguanylate cyclase (GGDEF)-like protein